MKNIFCLINLTALIIILDCGQSFGQTWDQQLFFRNISSDEGLSNPTINCIHEDARGFIWIGTNDGLNRYDGYEFIIYQQNFADSNSISNSSINAIYEDSNYNLWIGTNEGLCQFNYKNEKIYNYKSEDGFDRVLDIAHDKKNNRIWMASLSGGLKYLDLKTRKVRSFNNTLLKDALPLKLRIIHNELFIGTSNNGVYAMSLKSFTVEDFCNTKTGRFQIPNNRINVLHYYEEKLFIGTNGGGLIVYKFKYDNHVYYNPQNSILPSSFVTSMAHENIESGNVYFGTNKGLVIYNNNTEFVSSYHKEEGNISALSSNIINTLYVDKKDGLWVGTDRSGINYLNKESKKMTLVRKKFGTKNSLSGNNISCFAQDNNGGMWIGTRENGLSYYKDGKYTHFKTNGASSIADKSITDICIDQKGVVWVSFSNSGISRYENGKFFNYVNDKSDSNSIQSNKIKKIDIDKNGNLLLATSQGLESFDIEKKVFSHHFLDSGNKDLSKRKKILSLLVDSAGKVCAVTSNGFYVYNSISGKADVYRRDPNDFKSLGHAMVYDIFEDSEKRIWFGSLGWGLIRFDRESKAFTSYNKLKGFPVNSIKSIEEDENGNLWLGTNKGIVKFNPTTEQVMIFGISYGLQSNQFNRRASIKCNDGRFIFGGINGFNVFRPEELESEKNELDVIITDLSLFNQSVPIFGEPDILTQNISLVHSLRILYKQSKYFSVSFSALQFSNPDQVQYAFMLEGFDDDWNFIGQEHRVSFTNLEPKEYTLKVMASDNGLWDNKVRELKISIPPPWYMKPWLKGGAVLLLIVLIVSFYFYKIYTQKLRQRALEKLVVERNKEIACQNEEITSQNDALILSNDKLYAQHEEVLKQKEHIGSQNKELNEIHKELKNANSTLEKRVERRTKELKKSNVKLNKTVLELDRFVYSASHDLSAPLKSILGLVNIAKLENKDDNLEIYLDYIEDCIKKQDEVIKSLIQYSRNARQIIKVETINLFKFTNQIIYELKYLPGSERIDIFNEVEKEVTINSDKQRLKMILINLLSNAIKYRDKSKKHSFVKIQFSANEDSCALTVKDNGPGIAKDQKEKIFEMYYRATEESVGSGLGLFIVKEAVDRLGGKIELKSSIEEGATFVLTFPCK